MRIPVLLVVGLLFLFGISAGADTGINSIDTIFIPDKYYVGDRVELRIKLSIGEGYTLQAPKHIPESSWMTFHSVEIITVDEVSELRILFTPFVTGTRSLPPLNLGGVILSSVKLHTSSFIDLTDNKFVGIADQVLLPGTKLILVMFVSILIAGPLLVSMLLGLPWKKVKKFVRTIQGGSPMKRLNNVLHELEVHKDEISCRRFYIRLSRGFREYLSETLDIDFITLTTKDMGFALSPLVDSKFDRNISDMLQLADSIKFGQLTTDETRKINDIILIRNISCFIETKRKNSTSRRGSV